VYAVFTIVIQGISLAMTLLSIMALNWLYQSSGPVAKVLFDIFLPTDGIHITIKGWQIARLANACIALGVWVYADTASRRIDAGRWQEEAVQTIIGVVRTIQAALVVYTIFCTLVILYEFKVWDLLPKIEFQWFP
jgi:hypothetical protein